jgi:glycosyltransferase involved in cell wall biosynthesis
VDSPAPDLADDAAELARRLAVVVVTFNRASLLRIVLDSLAQLPQTPAHVIVVDNASSDDTPEVLAAAADRFPPGVLTSHRSQTNTGGSGGFHQGVELALATEAEWIWVMDDDVKVLPQALARLAPWTKRFQAIQGRRYNFDGSPFYWQFDFNTTLGIPNPVARDDFGPQGWLPMNTVCFEGGLFQRDLIQRIGLPDPRFFIYWDDTVYGYLASKVTQPALVDAFILARTRQLKRLSLGPSRKLNGTSDMVRYHIMRNRGYMAQYFALHGDYQPLWFALGTVLTLGKELIRLAAVDHSFKTGLPALVRGLRDARRLRLDRSWRPMPPLV